MKIKKCNIQIEFADDYFTGYCCYRDIQQNKFIKGAETRWCETWWKTWDYLWKMTDSFGQLLISFE